MKEFFLKKVTVRRSVNMRSFRQKQPPELLVRKGDLRNFTKFTGKHLCQGLFFNKVADSGTGVFLCILRNF